VSDNFGLLVVVAALGGYLLGSIPFGLLLTKLCGAGDLRTIGSGNIGATNVLRTGHKGLALATLLLDAGKGAAAFALFTRLDPALGLLAGGMAFIGHLYPVWLRFNGGKGVATMLGLVLAAYWPVGLGLVIVWLGSALITRYSSVGGMVAAAAAPILAGICERFELALLLVGVALLLLWKHRENIARLRAGTEPVIGRKAKPAGPAA
jgi:acyl phosphate:glycerol-3-phosphate acyltransferase